jgi:hypothetical protein
MATTENSRSSLQEQGNADPASPQAVKSMSSDEILYRWRGMLRELSAALVAVQEAAGAQAKARGRTSSSTFGCIGVNTATGNGSSSSSSSVFQRLEELTGRSKQLLGTALVLNPGEDAANLARAGCLGLQETASQLLPKYSVWVHAMHDSVVGGGRAACKHSVVECDMEPAALLAVCLPRCSSIGQLPAAVLHAARIA